MTKQHLACKSWRRKQMSKQWKSKLQNCVFFFWGSWFLQKDCQDDDHRLNENPILWIIRAQGNILTLHPELISNPDTLSKYFTYSYILKITHIHFLKDPTYWTMTGAKIGKGLTKNWESSVNDTNLIFMYLVLIWDM